MLAFMARQCVEKSDRTTAASNQSRIRRRTALQSKLPDAGSQRRSARASGKTAAEKCCGWRESNQKTAQCDNEIVTWWTGFKWNKVFGRQCVDNCIDRLHQWQIKQQVMVEIHREIHGRRCRETCGQIRRAALAFAARGSIMTRRTITFATASRKAIAMIVRSAALLLAHPRVDAMRRMLHACLKLCRTYRFVVPVSAGATRHRPTCDHR
jgi:hypothetical protein